jgi:glycosyltransferase involved in cell wall biosynthesis
MSALSSKQLITELKQENINTWFDLGLYIDRLRDQLPTFEYVPNDFNLYLSQLQQGIAFVSFDFGIDGVSMEVSKYAKAFEQFSEQISIHYIAGTFKKYHQTVIEERWTKHAIPTVDGFNGCDTYKDYFETKLCRGSKEYNQLIEKLWRETRILCKQIGEIIEQHQIQLLIPCNVNANPGNVALALAVVILSEKMRIPVLNSSHDFYWEDGKRPWQRDKNTTGVRDHFFTNAHLGEVFTLIEMLYPWDSSRWFQAVLSSSQQSTLIDKFGINPGNIGLMPTCVDLDCYRQVDDQERINILKRMEMLLCGEDQRLRSKAVNDFQDLDAGWFENAPPLLLGVEENISHTLLTGNLLFVQPTRIIARKRIEYDLDFIQSLLTHSKFKKVFDRNRELTITMYVSGPLAYPFTAHCDYFNQLTKAFETLLESIEPCYRKRVFLAFNFGAEKNSRFSGQSFDRLRIHEVYAVANLVLLPSKQEGRGLPLLEASAVEAPILTSRYDPEAVFREVIGEHLSADLRLKVYEYPENKQFSKKMLSQITALLFNPSGQQSTHNREVIEQRYSVEVLARTIKDFLYRIWFNCQPASAQFDTLQQTFDTVSRQTDYKGQFNQLVLCNNRKYIAGISDIEYMSYLKSLIDPSAFRMEEKEVKGRLMQYARYLVNTYVTDTSDAKNSAQQQNILGFYQQLNLIFYYQTGEDALAIDHSLSYRHRNRKHFPYRKMTEMELAGIATALMRRIFTDIVQPKISQHPHNVFQDLIGGIYECVGSDNIVIDDSERMASDLKANLPFGWFPGPNFHIESLMLIWRTLRARLGVKFGELLTAADLENSGHIAPVSVFVNQTSDGYRVNYATVCAWIEQQAPSEITALHRAGLVKIIATNCSSRGIHLGQLGNEAMNALIEIKNSHGFVVAIGESALLTLDMLDIPSYRIGRIHSKIAASFMHLNIDDSYIQWIPAGLRPSLSYPTPIQTPVAFSRVLNNESYQQCVGLFGETDVLKQLRQDADSFGTPIKQVLSRLLEQHSRKSSQTANDENSALSSSMITGLHEDGSPWSGAMAKVTQLETHQWNFDTLLTQQSNDTVLSLTQRFFKESTHHQKQKKKKKLKQSYIAWNGGYILNAELVGKLALSEKYIGSPLGLLIKNGRLLSLPLFNKPVLCFLGSGKITIKEAGLKHGFTLGKMDEELHGESVFTFKSTNYNRLTDNNLCYFDLIFEKETVFNENHIFYYLSGNTIIKIIRDQSQEIVLNPVGVSLAFPADQAPASWVEGSELNMTVAGWDDVLNAIEAGPRLIRDGVESIEIQAGGWKTQKSIATQAARVDFMDMRGPKIGVGINASGELIVVAINGRIRESVGATHIELAKILLQQGVQQAMGFDPGGSVTLVVDGEQLNISPYNKDYEKNPLSMPPQARFVGNAIIGCVNNQE